MTLIYSASITIFFGLLTYFYAHEIATMYTQDMDTLALLSNTLQSLSYSIALLGFTLSLQGTLRALQKQKVASQVLLLSLYLVSLPMAFWLAVDSQVGVTGLWTGFALGQVVTIFLYGFLILHVDWHEVFRLNRERKRESLQREIGVEIGGEAEEIRV